MGNLRRQDIRQKILKDVCSKRLKGIIAGQQNLVMVWKIQYPSLEKGKFSNWLNIFLRLCKKES